MNNGPFDFNNRGRKLCGLWEEPEKIERTHALTQEGTGSRTHNLELRQQLNGKSDDCNDNGDV